MPNILTFYRPCDILILSHGSAVCIVIKRPSIAKFWGALFYLSLLGWSFLACVSDCVASAVSAAVMPSGTASDAATALASVLSIHADLLMCSLAQVLLMPSASSGSTLTCMRTLSLMPPSLPQISRMRKSPQMCSLLRTSCKSATRFVTSHKSH